MVREKDAFTFKQEDGTIWDGIVSFVPEKYLSHHVLRIQSNRDLQNVKTDSIGLVEFTADQSDEKGARTWISSDQAIPQNQNNVTTWHWFDLEFPNTIANPSTVATRRPHEVLVGKFRNTQNGSNIFEAWVLNRWVKLNDISEIDVQVCSQKIAACPCISN